MVETTGLTPLQAAVMREVARGGRILIDPAAKRKGIAILRRADGEEKMFLYPVFRGLRGKGLLELEADDGLGGREYALRPR
jgi:hypothetical protein